MNFTAEQNKFESLLTQAAAVVSEMARKASAQLEAEREVNFKGTVTTIPMLLVEVRGNQTEAAKRLNSNRATIRKYARDFTASHHAIVNGVLMASKGQIGEHMRRKANAATS